MHEQDMCWNELITLICGRSCHTIKTTQESILSNLALTNLMKFCKIIDKDIIIKQYVLLAAI